ncbi:hypothetical protein COOONC_11274 [Cooperia oncophora]
MLYSRDDQRYVRDRRHDEPPRPQYNVEYPQSPIRQDDRDTYEPQNRQRAKPNFWRHYDGPNEYMTEEPSYARPANQSKRFGGQSSTNMSRSRMDGTRNEYMTNERDYSSRSKPKEQYSRRHMDPSFSQNYDDPNEYMTEPSYAKPTDNRSRRYGDSENVDPSYSRMHESGSRQKYRNVRRQVNEYMTDRPEAPIETLRDSSVPEMRERETSIPLSHPDRFDAFDKRMLDRAGSSRPGGSKTMLYRGRDMSETRSDHRASGWVDDKAIPAGLPRRSGGAPRFGAKSLAKGPFKRRHRPGALALKEIRRYQKSVGPLIQKLPVQRVIREVVQQLYPEGGYRFTIESLCALQEVCLMFRKKLGWMVLLWLVISITGLLLGYTR